MNVTRNKLIYKVLRNYYEKGLTQQEIADKYNISRIKVSRLIRKALDDKIVQIRINIPIDATNKLEQKIEELYGIEDAIVVAVQSKDIIQELGEAVAAYLTMHIQSDDIIGITWGRFISASINAMPEMNYPNVRIVQILGGLGDPASNIHGTELAIRMARKLEAKARLLHSPGIVRSKEIRKALMENTQIFETLKLAENASFALVGIGTFNSSASLLRESEIITGEEVSRLIQKGGVGNISLRSFDEWGNQIPDEIDERVVGLTYNQIKRIPRIIGVAGGNEKHRAIMAALRGKWVNTLITDDQTAQFLIENSKKS
jgi:DNA-binding transcriptional regulator LsrR (DeoR family)